jgi:carboxyl-terminal processing protease
MVGTPAYEAGVQAGDIIMKIDGKSTENMRLSEAVDLIQGDPGQKIVLTVLHEGADEPVDLEMARAEIQVQTVLGDLRKADSPKEWDFFLDKENRLAYVRLVSTFSEKTASDLRRVLEQLQQEGMRGLVLDLRNNPGGLLSAAVDVADLFLTEGRVVSTRGRNEAEKVYNAREDGTLLMPPHHYPMAVLINKYSASASEIVAAALQDHKRAVVVGERSYGKGSVQNIIDLKEPGNRNSALKLTTASYWRPNGKNIHRFPDSKESEEWGVKPDEGFEVVLKDKERGEYFLYRRDRDIVHGKPGTPPPPRKQDKSKDEPPFVDRTLEKALEYLRGAVNKVGLVPGSAPLADA